MTTPVRTVNGYTIREALKRWERQRTIASKLFNDCLYRFKDDTNKQSPQDVMQQFQQADTNYAKLQDIQQDYNRNTTVTIGGEQMRMSLAVKLIGGAGRIEKMWSDSLGHNKQDRYSSYRSGEPLQRSKEVEYAVRQITEKECLQQVQFSSQYASNLRSAIALANTTSVTLTTITDQEFRTLFGDEQQGQQGSTSSAGRTQSQGKTS
jgi:hypothetical protein